MGFSPPIFTLEYTVSCFDLKMRASKDARNLKCALVLFNPINSNSNNCQKIKSLPQNED